MVLGHAWYVQNIYIPNVFTTTLAKMVFRNTKQVYLYIYYIRCFFSESCTWTLQTFCNHILECLRTKQVVDFLCGGQGVIHYVKPFSGTKNRYLHCSPENGTKPPKLWYLNTWHLLFKFSTWHSLSDLDRQETYMPTYLILLDWSWFINTFYHT